MAAAQAFSQAQGAGSSLRVHGKLPVYTAAAPTSLPTAQQLSGQFDAVQKQSSQLQLRPFPNLSTFRTVSALYNTATYSDELNCTMSFAAMEAADPKWRKNFPRQRFAEINAILQEVKEKMVERQVTDAVAVAEMERDRQNLKMQVAKYVKHIQSLRAQRNKGASKALQQASSSAT